jgi:hypothetical protein
VLQSLLQQAADDDHLGDHAAGELAQHGENAGVADGRCGQGARQLVGGGA